MALTTSMSVPNTELSVDNTYAKIVSFSGTKELVSLTVFYYSKKPSLDEQVVRYYSDDFNFVPTLDGANFIEQGYNFLKTLPQFAEAQDC
jgi:hypothetical protein